MSKGENEVHDFLHASTIGALLKDVRTEKDRDRIRKKEVHEKAIADQQELLAQLSAQKFSTVVERKKVLDEAKRKLVDLKSQSPRYSPMQLIAMKDTDSLDVTIKTLQENNILSIPVSSATTTQLRGFIDMLDIVYYAQTHLSLDKATSSPLATPEQKTHSISSPTSPTSTGSASTTTAETSKSVLDTLPKPPTPVSPQHAPQTADLELKKATLADVIKALGREAVEIEETCPIAMLVQLFTSGDRRAAVLSKDKKAILGIISQSDVVRHLSTELRPGRALANVGAMTIADLGHGIKAVVSIAKKQTVAEALKLLVEKKVSSLAVVDYETKSGEGGSSGSLSSSSSSTSTSSGEKLGKLVGNFSASDFRFITHDHFKKFKVTSWRVDTFLGSVHHHSLVPITIKSSHTLTYVADLLVEHSFHHIWVADDEGHPIGIVSLTDVLKMLLGYKGKGAK